MSAPTDGIAGAVDKLLDHDEERGSRALKMNAMAGTDVIDDLLQRARRLHYDWVDHAFGAWLDAARGRAAPGCARR